MKILFAGFGGEYNSSKILLDHLGRPEKDKLYLVNSDKTSVRQLTEKMDGENYDCVVILGQWGRVPKGVLRLETLAKKGRYEHATKFPVQELASLLEKYGYEVQISNFAGRWLCNNVYFYGLKHLEQTGQRCKMVFIHIPKDRDITDYAKLAQTLEKSVARI